MYDTLVPLTRVPLRLGPVLSIAVDARDAGGVGALIANVQVTRYWLVLSSFSFVLSFSFSVLFC